MNLYCDIDGTLITHDGKPAAYLKDFLVVVTNKYTCHWLTTHCRGGENRAEAYLRRILPENNWHYLNYFMPTDWSTLKTEAIDFSQEFRWFDDTIFEAEKEVLRKNNYFDSFIKVDLINNPEQLKDIARFLLQR